MKFIPRSEIYDTLYGDLFANTQAEFDSEFWSESGQVCHKNNVVKLFWLLDNETALCPAPTWG
jgi:hypothetical protein